MAGILNIIISACYFKFRLRESVDKSFEAENNEKISNLDPLINETQEQLDKKESNGSKILANFNSEK